MNTLGIILIIYFAVAIVITIFVFIKRKRPLSPVDQLMGKKQKPIWQVLLPLPIYPLAIILYGLIMLIDPKVSRGNDVSKHLKSQADFDKEYEEINVDTIDIEEGMEDSPQKAASLCLGEELHKKNLSTFPLLLDEDVTQVNYDLHHFKKICGKGPVVDYWNDWMKKQSEKGLTHKFSIVKAKYFSTEALQIDYYADKRKLGSPQLIILSFNDSGKVQRILFTSSYISYTDFKKGTIGLLSTLESLSPDTVTQDFEIDKHIPCMKCGKESSELLWFGYNHIAYGGNISICPTCKDVVENYCFIHYAVDYSSDYFPIYDNIEYIKNKLSNGEPLGEPKDACIIGRNSFYLTPIYDVLKQLDSTIEGSLKEQLLYAANNGIYEAYNNLAKDEKDDEMYVKYLKLGAEHGVANCLLNLSLYYYQCDETVPFCNYTARAAQEKSIVAMYNDAAILQIGFEFGIDPKIENAISKYLEVIEECYRQDNDDSERVLQHSYYNLGLIYYKEYGKYEDLLRAYAYLNQCPTQDDKVRDLKVCIYQRILDIKDGKYQGDCPVQVDDEDLPF